MLQQGGPREGICLPPSLQYMWSRRGRVAPDECKTRQPWLGYMSQPSFVLIYDFFSTVGKHISHAHASFIFAKKRVKLLCAELVVLTCFRLKTFFPFFQFLWADFTNIPRALALRLTTSGANATHHLQNAPSLISL